MKKIVALVTVMVIAATFCVTSWAYDLRTVSGITAEELKVYMHKDVKFLAEDVVRICNENGISAEFVATVMRWERRMDLNNFFGWMRSDGKLMRFDDPVECLEKIIPLIKKNYLTEGGKCFNGYTVDAVSLMYNNSDYWREKIYAGTMNIVNSEQERKSEEAAVNRERTENMIKMEYERWGRMLDFCK